MIAPDRLALCRRLLFAGVGITVVCLCILYFFADSASGYYPRCAFKMLTGLSCPGCGSQRAVHAMFQGDFRGAFSYNALFMVELPILGLLAFSRLTGDRFPRMRRVLSDRLFILLILATIIIWTIVRNIFDL